MRKLISLIAICSIVLFSAGMASAQMFQWNAARSVCVDCPIDVVEVCEPAVAACEPVATVCEPVAEVCLPASEAPKVMRKFAKPRNFGRFQCRSCFAGRLAAVDACNPAVGACEPVADVCEPAADVCEPATAKAVGKQWKARGFRGSRSWRARW